MRRVLCGEHVTKRWAIRIWLPFVYVGCIMRWLWQRRVLWLSYREQNSGLAGLCHRNLFWMYYLFYCDEIIFSNFCWDTLHLICARWCCMSGCVSFNVKSTTWCCVFYSIFHVLHVYMVYAMFSRNRPRGLSAWCDDDTGVTYITLNYIPKHIWIGIHTNSYSSNLTRLTAPQIAKHFNTFNNCTYRANTAYICICSRVGCTVPTTPLIVIISRQALLPVHKQSYSRARARAI